MQSIQSGVVSSLGHTSRHDLPEVGVFKREYEAAMIAMDDVSPTSIIQVSQTGPHECSPFARLG